MSCEVSNCISRQLRLVATILVWALLLNSSKWFEWRAVAASEKCIASELGMGRLENLTSRQEILEREEQWTIDRSTNMSGNWEGSTHLNSTLKLARTTKEVASGSCEFQVVPFRLFDVFLSSSNNHIIFFQEFNLQKTDLRNDNNYIIGFMNVCTIVH